MRDERSSNIYRKNAFALLHAPRGGGANPDPGAAGARTPGLLGLPGAALYRLANTADAMWGYPGMHGGRYWQWAGKWAARADDVLSWLPARITALLLAVLARGLPPATLARQARRTPSPNSGWPMAAMALALGVRLGKPGVYVLNASARDPGPLDTRRAAKLGSLVALSLIPLAVGAHLLITIVSAWVGA